jgi:hypothetical protein
MSEAAQAPRREYAKLYTKAEADVTQQLESRSTGRGRHSD